MKRYFLSLLFFLILALCYEAKGAIPAYLDNPKEAKLNGFDEDFYIFLCFGQSNFEGANKPEAFDYTGVDRCYMYATIDNDYDGRQRGKWYPAIPPYCVKTGGMSGADYFIRTLARALPDKKIGVINVAVGGCTIELFDPEDNSAGLDGKEDWLKNAAARYDGSKPYQHLVSCAKDAQKYGVIKGILLHQGESNSGDTNWPQKVQKIYQHLISDLNLNAQETPLLAGELLREENNGSCWRHNEIIATLPDLIPNARVVSSEGCVGSPYDHVHFFPAGYRKLGYHYAYTYLTECLGFNPDDVPAEIVAPPRANGHIWDGKYYSDYYPPLRIPGDRFADLKVGDCMRIIYLPRYNGSDVARLQFNTTGRPAKLADAPALEVNSEMEGVQYHDIIITPDNLKQLQATGLEIGQPGAIIISVDFFR